MDLCCGIDMCIHMLMHSCIHMCVDTFIGMCIDMGVDMCIDMRFDVCIKILTRMRIRLKKGNRNIWPRPRSMGLAIVAAPLHCVHSVPACRTVLGQPCAAAAACIVVGVKAGQVLRT